MRPSEKLRNYVDLWRGDKAPELMGIANEVDALEYRLQVSERELRDLRKASNAVRRDAMESVLSMVREYHGRNISPIHLMGACVALTQQITEALAALDKDE